MMTPQTIYVGLASVLMLSSKALQLRWHLNSSPDQNWTEAVVRNHLSGVSTAMIAALAFTILCRSPAVATVAALALLTSYELGQAHQSHYGAIDMSDLLAYAVGLLAFHLFRVDRFPIYIMTILRSKSTGLSRLVRCLSLVLLTAVATPTLDATPPPARKFEIKYRLKNDSSTPQQKVVIQASNPFAAKKIFRQQNPGCAIVGTPKEVR